MSEIIIIIKGSLDKAVPIISIAKNFNANNHNVRILCGCISPMLKENFRNTGISITSLNINENDGKNPFSQKIRSWVSFRIGVKRFLKTAEYEYLYIATGDTAIDLKGIYDKSKYILHLRELYDSSPLYMKLLEKIARRAYKVVVPELNRAYLYYHFLKLDTVPSIIVNRPFDHPRTRKMDIDFLDPEIQTKIKTKKNIIYQGPIARERDLTKLVEASLEWNSNEYNLILLGKDYGMLDVYRKINPNILHIPFVSPPLHLNITSWAYIGVIAYDLKSLNTIYCAPNKVWEFSGFGIPVLGSCNPGLFSSIGYFNAGKLVDFYNCDKIINGIDFIINNYDIMRKNAVKMYDNAELNINELLNNS
ncbi:MAG: hypothetical protein LKI53_05310 [Bacteroidales bacterium]|jgi:hypothetical protein|nr:hypothetical protein [Bacteroidales bacterium]